MAVKRLHGRDLWPVLHVVLLLRARSSELTSSSERRCATPDRYAERALLLIVKCTTWLGKSDDDVFFSTSREIVQLSGHLLQDIKS
jgi:hypothetical protein